MLSRVLFLHLVASHRGGTSELIGKAPAAVTPGQIPARLLGQDLRRRVETGAAVRAAAADARKAHPAAGPEAVADDRLLGIGRAGRQVTALPPQNCRQRITIKAQATDRCQPRPRGKPSGTAAKALDSLAKMFYSGHRFRFVANQCIGRWHQPVCRVIMPPSLEHDAEKHETAFGRHDALDYWNRSRSYFLGWVQSKSIVISGVSCEAAVIS